MSTTTATTDRPSAFFPSVALQSFCANCGAALTPGAEFCGGIGARISGALTPAAAPVTDPRLRYKTVGTDSVAVPAPVFYASVALVIMLALFLLVFLLYGGLGHAWDQAQHGHSIAFHNTTDTLLCYGGPECGAEIKPRATSHWAMDCNSVRVGVVTVYTPQGRELYRRVADRHDWTGAFLIINERDGEFIVADSINAPTEPAIPFD